MRAALLLSLITCTSALAASKYTDHMYRKAVDDDSTSPLYLLFTLHDPKTGADRVVCAPGIGLVGAIHFEHHLDFDEISRKAARRIALSQLRHRFVFSNRKALHTVRPYYSEKVLTEVRQLLARKSNSQLIHEGTLYTAHPQYTLDDVYAKRSRRDREAYQDATAHVLLERGILVGSDDRTGLLYVDR
jgi:hypothetical protein